MAKTLNTGSMRLQVQIPTQLAAFASLSLVVDWEVYVQLASYRSARVKNRTAANKNFVPANVEDIFRC